MAGRMTGLTLFTPIRCRWAWFLWLALRVTRHLPGLFSQRLSHQRGDGLSPFGV